MYLKTGSVFKSKLENILLRQVITHEHKGRCIEKFCVKYAFSKLRVPI